MLRLTAVLSLVVTAAALLSTTPRDEPPLRLSIEIGGKSYEASVGEPVEIAVGDQKATLTVAVKPTRRFAAAGITFDYPNDMRYSFDDEDGITMWTLDGDACMLMVQRLDEGKAEELAPIVLAEIVADNDNATAPETFELQLGKQKTKALRATVTHDSYTETWTAIGVDAKGLPIILLLQEIVDEDGSSARQRQRLLDLFAATFAVTQ